MTDKQSRRPSGGKIAALRFAGRRQLARWSDNPKLSPNQQAQRKALTRAVRILQEDAFAGGCELHSPTDGQHADA